LSVRKTIEGGATPDSTKPRAPGHLREGQAWPERLEQIDDAGAAFCRAALRVLRTDNQERRFAAPNPNH
jgi:hypothetical protein